jgi:hypothetical protein
MISLICKLRIVCLVLLISGPMVPMAVADTVTFQHLRSNDFVASYTGVRDTELLASGFADYNAGGRTTMQWNAEREAILRFGDVNVMAGQYNGISSAKIVLTKATVSELSSPFFVDMFQISDANAGWGAGSSMIAPASPGEATWNNRAHPGTSWDGSPGLSTPGVDYVATALDSVELDPEDPHNLTFYEWDISTSLVSQWITGGVNAGVKLKLASAVNPGLQVYTSDFAFTQFTPRLVVDYEPLVPSTYTPAFEPRDTSTTPAHGPGVTDFGKQWVRSNPYTLYGWGGGQYGSAGVDDQQYMELGFTALQGREPLQVAAADASNFTWHAYSELTEFAPSLTDAQDAVARIIDAGGGQNAFMLSDEPGESSFPFLGQVADWIRANYPETLIYVDHFSGAGSSYISNLMATVKPDILMSNTFSGGPVTASGLDVNHLFSALTGLRNEGLLYDVPYFAHVPSFVEGSLQLPSESELRTFMFSHLAAGYQGMAYFSYYSSDAPSLLNQNWSQGPLYDAAMQANPEVTRLGKSLRLLDSIDVVRFIPGTAASEPSGTSLWVVNAGNDPRILDISITTNGSGSYENGQIGFFEDDQAHKYFMVTNLNHGHTASAAATSLDFTIDFDTSVTELLRLNRLTGKQELIVLNSNTLDFTLPGGTGDLFKYNDGIFPGFILGDFNDENGINNLDIDLLFAKIGAGGVFDSRFDVTLDGSLINSADMDELIHNIIGTEYGDANLDGNVDGGDFLIWQRGFGTAGGWSFGDFNGDGVVSALDLTILESNYGFQSALMAALGDIGSSSVPEPASLMLLSLGGLTMMGRRRRGQ